LLSVNTEVQGAKRFVVQI